MKQTELIIFLVIVAINGGIALWKKMKERQAAALAARAQQSSPAPGSVARSPAKTSPPRTTSIDARIQARAEARKAPRPAPAARTTPAPPAATAARPAPSPRVTPVLAPAPSMRPSAPVAAVVPPAATAARTLRHGLAPRPGTRFPTSVEGLRAALIAAEVLGPPRSVRPWAPAAGR